MSSNSENSARIAKNTLMLYIRMSITLGVGLFTSRVILDALGVEDYGIYNVVGGFVVMFSVVRAGLVSATQRFITYDLGKGDLKELNCTFSTCVIIYLALSLILVVMAEAMGVWFIENKLSIPVERLQAALWVFQFSLIMLVVSLISFPYNALIISHEKMKAFAYISIYEVVAKLAVVYLLYITLFDKLVVYSLLQCIVQITIPIIYFIYCRKNFVESRVTWQLDLRKLKQIYAFTGWAMFGGIASIGFTEGLNVLLGMFFTPVINAARGIAVQVQGVITQFVGNFQLAVDPQIVKSYARGDSEYMQKLVCFSSKYSFYLLFLLSLPVILEAEQLLSLWLVEVPQYTVLFFRLIIITTMYDAFSNPFGKAIHATGNIRNYQLICSTLLIAVVPISYIVLKLGGEPYSVFIVHIILGFFAAAARIVIACRIACISVRMFIKSVAIPVIFVVVLSIMVPLIIRLLMPYGIARLFVVSFVSVLSVTIFIFVVGINSEERKLFINKIKGALVIRPLLFKK